MSGNALHLVGSVRRTRGHAARRTSFDERNYATLPGHSRFDSSLDGTPMLVWVARPHRCNRAHGTGENFFRMRNSPFKFARVLFDFNHPAGPRRLHSHDTALGGKHAHNSQHVYQLRTLQLGPPTATLTNDALQRVGRGPSSLSHERNSRTRPPHLIACPAFACTPPLYAPASASFRQPPLSNRPAPAPPLLLLWKAAVEGLEPLAGTPID